MTELETRLVKALDTLSGYVEDVEKRLDGMTRNYQLLSRQMKVLSEQLRSTEDAHSRLMQSLEIERQDQQRLEAQLTALQKQLSASSGKP
jgi:chromosome segregation ATPase